jgi:Ca2+/Na+ antiporter
MTEISGPAMPWHDVITWMFLIGNGGRIVAYLPQIMSAWYCPTGAKSVSVLTWSYFAFAHLTALLYALFVLHDSRSVWIFSGNLAVTACLVALLLWKRMRYRQSLRGLQRNERTRAPEIEMPSLFQHQ